MTTGVLRRRAALFSLLLVLFSANAERRDPFQAEEAQRCQVQVRKEAEALSSWRLRGVIRSRGVERGWAQTPEGKWRALSDGFSLAYWRLLNIEGGTARFSAVPSLKSRCRPGDVIELTLGKY
ncbi:hypothetical protein SOASR030_16450 [Leminorella grimontii]|uniref:DUF2531 family protein n=1 Tax=Leminorella grimontii TaxID=82981 RepID=A0AAV5N1Z0_9GAMM|nr:DNA utilization family protein [Leminorella grimontii]KFC93769.1 hypothetical protein GLGR_3334 [Leminorella grimontii ATCC 33999 = DSM 5078]GKX55533.1 hypothetical protein SOASR030_16450 [Leminorella grimontii]GKX59342.1 hypothetical protein SOASR031_16570 [Leminorella grimontii]